MTTPVQQLIERLSGHNYIQGAYVASQGQREPVVDPSTGQVIGHYALSTESEVDQAVAHANAAQRAWWARSALERADALLDTRTPLPVGLTKREDLRMGKCPKRCESSRPPPILKWNMNEASFEPRA